MIINILVVQLSFTFTTLKVSNLKKKLKSVTFTLNNNLKHKLKAHSMGLALA